MHYNIYKMEDRTVYLSSTALDHLLDPAALYSNLSADQLEFFRLPQLRSEADRYMYIINPKVITLIVPLSRSIPAEQISARLINICAAKIMFATSEAARSGYSIQTWIITDRTSVIDELACSFDKIIKSDKIG